MIRPRITRRDLLIGAAFLVYLGLLLWWLSLLPEDPWGLRHGG